MLIQLYNYRINDLERLYITGALVERVRMTPHEEEISLWRYQKRTSFTLSVCWWHCFVSVCVAMHARKDITTSWLILELQSSSGEETKQYRLIASSSSVMSLKLRQHGDKASTGNFNQKSWISLPAFLFVLKQNICFSDIPPIEEHLFGSTSH